METIAHAEQGRGTAWLLGSACALVLALVVGVAIGPAGPAWWRVPLELLDRIPFVSVNSGITATDWSIIWNIRMPRVVLAALVGSTLSIAGASYQGVFRNPLVDPYLLGVAAGAGLGATVVFTVNRSGSLSWPVDPLPLVSFLGGLAAVLVTYVVGSAFGSDRSSTTLVLAGVNLYLYRQTEENSHQLCSDLHRGRRGSRCCSTFPTRFKAPLWFVSVTG